MPYSRATRRTAGAASVAAPHFSPSPSALPAQRASQLLSVSSRRFPRYQHDTQCMRSAMLHGASADVHAALPADLRRTAAGAMRLS